MFKFIQLNNAVADNDKMLMHPVVYEKLVKHLKNKGIDQDYLLSLIEIDISECISKHPLKWQFPNTPFVTYEESDKSWAIPIKFGSYIEDTSEYCIFLLGKYRFSFHNDYMDYSCLNYLNILKWPKNLFLHT